MKNYSKNFRGFTLIEILIVIGIIAILATIVVVAINPSRQFAQARNTQRSSNIEAILNAIGQRMADNKGVFQGSFGASNNITCPSLPSTTSKILHSPSIVNTGEVDLSCLVPTYMALFPSDPSIATATDSGYTVEVDTYGRVKVCAPAAASETSLPGSTSLCISR